MVRRKEMAVPPRTADLVRTLSRRLHVKPAQVLSRALRELAARHPEKPPKKKRPPRRRAARTQTATEIVGDLQNSVRIETPAGIVTLRVLRVLDDGSVEFGVENPSDLSVRTPDPDARPPKVN